MRPTRATPRPRRSSTFRPAQARDDRPAAGRCRRRARPADVSRGGVAERARPRSEGGRVSVRLSRCPSSKSSTRLRTATSTAARDVSRGVDDSPRWPQVYEIGEARNAGGLRSRRPQGVAAIRDLDPDATDLEGYLFPETYRCAATRRRPTLVEQMVGVLREDVHARDARRREGAGLDRARGRHAGVAGRKGNGSAEERPLVAAVYLNRKRIGMPMQADPTVIFALQRAGRYDGNLRRDDLQFDSPYNTYRYPGPAARSDRRARQGVARSRRRPGEVDYLYFVSKNDGSHVFARRSTNTTATCRSGRSSTSGGKETAQSDLQIW